MSHRQLSAASELLDIRILIDEVATALRKRVALSNEQRDFLKKSFHQYITRSPNHLRSRAVSKKHGDIQDLAYNIVRDTAGDGGPALLKVIDRLSAGDVSKHDKEMLLAFFEQLDSALYEGRSSVQVGRYL